MSFTTVEEKFQALADAWEDEHPGSSIMRFDSFAYHQIIGMGMDVVPLLIDRLRDGEGHWVYALTCIAGTNEHTDEMVGDADRVIQAWVGWYDRFGGGHGRIAT